MSNIFLYNAIDVPPLAKIDDIEFCPYRLSHFNNGEIFVTLHCDVGDKNVFVWVDTLKEVDNFQKSVFVVTELKNRRAKSIHLIFLYLPYLRRYSVKNLKNISDIILQNLFDAGADSLITLDPHVNDFCSKFEDKVKILSAKNVFIGKIKSFQLADFCCIAPDAGAKKINAEIAGYFNKPCFVAEKKRDSTGTIESLKFQAEHIPQNAIIIDDMIDSGSTMDFLIDILLEVYPKLNIFIFCSHAIFSKRPSFLDKDQVKNVFAVNLTEGYEGLSDKIEQLDFGDLLCQTVQQIIDMGENSS